MQIDVFNGDADGICGLVQLRLANPTESQLVTGTKRDIHLLANLSVVANDSVTVLDISLKKNRPDVDRILQQGASVFYIDHHEAGDIPLHPRFKSMINTAANTCTSLLVDEYLAGKFRAWAVTAAFGDNLIGRAEQLSQTLGLTVKEIEQLKNLGVCINYNGYGSALTDLHFEPAVLYRHLVQHQSPFNFIADNPTIHEQLLAAYIDDREQALLIKPEYMTAAVALYILPDQAWARRVFGVFGNELANNAPERAHAVLTHHPKGGYQVSVRAPLNNSSGADELCTLFASGGGRKSAAGINHLPMNELAIFMDAFVRQYS